jgi:hypothetical protein
MNKHKLVTHNLGDISKVRVCVRARHTNKQTDQTTTLCVQEVEIYLERWEVLGALVDVCVWRRGDVSIGKRVHVVLILLPN